MIFSPQFFQLLFVGDWAGAVRCLDTSTGAPLRQYSARFIVRALAVALLPAAAPTCESGGSSARWRRSRRAGKSCSDTMTSMDELVGERHGYDLQKSGEGRERVNLSFPPL